MRDSSPAGYLIRLHASGQLETYLDSRTIERVQNDPPQQRGIQEMKTSTTWIVNMSTERLDLIRTLFAYVRVTVGGLLRDRQRGVRGGHLKIRISKS